MKCRNCGVELDEQAHFCGDCGTPVRIDAPDGADAKIRRKKLDIDEVQVPLVPDADAEGGQPDAVYGETENSDESQTVHGAESEDTQPESNAEQETQNAEYQAASAAVSKPENRSGISDGWSPYNPANQPPPAKICKTCGKIIRGDARFCENCGMFQGPVTGNTDRPQRNPLMFVLIGVGAVLAIALIIAIITVLSSGGRDDKNEVSPSPPPIRTQAPTLTPIPTLTPMPTPTPTLIPTSTPVPTTTPKPMPTQAPKSAPAPQKPNVVSNPSYETYENYEYSITCPYPSHFKEYYEPSEFFLESLKDADNTANLQICGTVNDNGRSADAVIDNFIHDYQGTVVERYAADSWCKILTKDSSKYHFGYFELTNGMIRGIEFHFDAQYYDTYVPYINYIVDWVYIE